MSLSQRANLFSYVFALSIYLRYIIGKEYLWQITFTLITTLKKEKSAFH